MQAEVEERVQALVYEPVASPLEALALVVHATALSLSWKTLGDVETLRDRASCRAYNAGGRTIETAVVRMGRHAVVLATDVGEREASIETAGQRGVCTSCELVLDEFLPSSALPLRASNAHDMVTQALVERISATLSPLGSDVRPTPSPSVGMRTQSVTNAPTLPTAAIPSHSSPNPLRVGDADRDPLAASGLHPFPSGGSAMPPLAPSGDGMVVGPSHPLFQDRSRSHNDQTGPWGGDGFLPPGAVPPGARFDPVGPFAGGAPRFPRGGPRGPSGNPDWDDLPPPGGGPGSMYL
ncbi:hypothetical protein MBRA1_001528 [Malassezia brasiliensis]|uniref:PI31 proteasome regulator C-terminal domain-containing protein n=1 Tax=Malassezia brasiliensis TaxID=1821822 RepID=A0AAF0IPF8_9BASI|nr:hypothetical protein MBRA1_001528 [Malassezia brasiliensis]